MRAPRILLVAMLLAGVAACAPKTVRVPVVTTPQYPEYIEPTIPADLAASRVSAQHERAWLFLQAGDLRGAEREAAAVLRLQPAFFPTQTLVGYLALARKDERDAVAQFDQAIAARPTYAPALAGKGLALIAEGRTADALDAFRAAVQADPSLTDIGRRIDVLTLRSLQEELASAREAARAGNTEVALQAYRNAVAASPDSAFLYREMAGIERQRGDARAAIQHLERANALDPSDPASFATLGELLEEQGDTEAALQAYADSLALDANPDVQARRSALRARLDLEALPEPYRAIPSSAQLTRAELAALVGVRLASLLQAAPARDVGVITDVRGHWAERWIAATARAGVLEPFANHTFQPRAIVRRVDFAQAVARLLNLLASVSPAQARSWQGARGRFTDITTGHIAYPAASAAIASGVMLPGPGGSFQPTRVVSGEEAIAALDRLRALAGPTPTQASDRR
jgi:tetratricopeptide (TPR) repeat protein